MKNRAQLSHAVRVAAADLAQARPHPRHIANGDERRIATYAASFTKGLPHDENGFVIPLAGEGALHPFELLVRGIDRGREADLREVPLGPFKQAGSNWIPDTDDGGQYVWRSAIAKTGGEEMKPVKVRAWESAGAGSAFDLEGPDAQALTMPPASVVGSPELVGEIAEVLGQSLLRDVAFAEFDTDATAARVVGLLAKIPWFCGADVGALDGAAQKRRRLLAGKAASLWFRGLAPGDDEGPYISQFLLIGNPSLGASGTGPHLAPGDGYISYGGQRIDQRVRVATPDGDYMKTWDEWLDVQNGADLRGLETYVSTVQTPTSPAMPAYRFITTPRDLCTYVHHDQLYQAYLNAAIILLSAKAPFDPGVPFSGDDRVDRQQAFAVFGGPHLLSLVTEVASRALKAVRFQKFNVHRRARPEVLAARVEQNTPGFGDMAADAGLSAIRAAVNAKHGTSLLPMAFPEGSPMHPSYGAGHATVAGACVTILKAFFDTRWVLNPPDPELKKEGLVPAQQAYVGAGSVLKLVGAPTLTLEGELNKLAANISIGRDWAGVHYFSDYWESLLLGEQVALGILEEQKLTHGENFSMTVPLFDGGAIRI